MVEMTAAAITARLETLSRLYDPKAGGLDMSAKGIDQRLRELSDLSRFCAALTRIGPGRESR